MFGEVGMPEIAKFLWSFEALASCQDAGRLWVITDSGDRPAGFLITDVVDGCLHVAQLSVDPGSARRGLAGLCSTMPPSWRRPLACLR
jgi:hypothetical protein